MSNNPDIQWALDILTPDPDYKPSIWEKYGMLVGMPLTLFGGACLRNSLLKRPYYAGFQVHIAVSIIGLALGYKMHQIVDNYFAKRDQILRDYIIKHPEDFPPPERKKWGELFEPWYPMR